MGIIINRIDCHSHTQYSMDSKANIRAMIERAIELNLEAYAITDHCEINWWYPKEYYSMPMLSDHFGYGADFEASISAITLLKEEYSEQINLICGIEMGQAFHNFELATKVNYDTRVDFIIGSIHQIRNELDFFFIDYNKMTEYEIYDYLDRYFKEIYELCQINCFDILGHLTYSTRYLDKLNGFIPNMHRFDEIIAESFRLLIKNGKGIEINTSGLRKPQKVTFPTLEYVKLFRNLGGEIISIGSDAHTVEDLGANINDGIEIAKSAGFSYLCYFKKRKPQFVSINNY